MTLSFQVHGTDAGSGARRGTLVTARGEVATPALMAVGTRASVTGLDPSELRAMGASVVLERVYRVQPT